MAFRRLCEKVFAESMEISWVVFTRQWSVLGSTPVKKESKCPQDIYLGESAQALREKYREKMESLMLEEGSASKTEFTVSPKRVS